MNEGSSFLKRFPWLTSKTRTSDLESFLNSLPQSVLLIDSASWEIQLANSRALDFTNYTQSELVGLDARTLFGDCYDPFFNKLNSFKSLSPADPPVIIRIIRRDQLQVPARTTVSPLKNDEKFSLLFLEPAESIDATQGQGDGSPFWGGLNELFCAEKEAEILPALNQALSAAESLSGADILLIYRLMDGVPEIRRLTALGNADLLPEVMDMQDLVSLNEVRYWEPGKQPSCSLYRSARAASIRYVASAPIGQNTAQIGLAVLASTRSAPPAAILEIVRLLAVVSGSIFQNYIHRSNIKGELSQQSLLTTRLSTITERVQEGVMQLSPELHIRSVNQRLEQTLGYSSREVAGEAADKILIGNEKIQQALKQAMEGETVLNLGDVSLFRRNGQSFQAMVRIFPVFSEKRLDEVLVFIQDLSEKEQIRLHAQELENRAWLGELMAVFAHEVRNPINNISTGLQFMGMSLSADDPQQASISRMLQDCDRLDQLIKSVLAYSKPIEYEMASLDLGGLLQRLIDRQRGRNTNSIIRYELQIDPDCPPVSGNLRSLEQVFNNLITNAVQAMSGIEGILSIKMLPAPHDEGVAYVDIYVADTGPGIPKEILDKIFQPFLTTKQGGTGLGLSIAKRIITAHKGNIQVSSFPGGTVFHVQLPIYITDAR